MSGAAGGNRIKRQDVKPTVKDYIDKVLSKYDKYVKSEITGSFYTLEKNDFGDIDLIVELNENDKVEAKKRLVKYFNKFSNDIIIPFKSNRYFGKKALNTGEIVTILYPIKNEENSYVQIDNIISLSEKETIFKQKFLNLPAIKQGLMLGLIKTIILEKPELVEKFTIPHALKHNQELEFNLSSSGLTLRLVTLDDNFKTLDKKDVWKTQDWNIVEYILSDFDFDQSFDNLLKDIKKKMKNKRSLKRIKGIFKSMVSVKSGEQGTLKGNEKQRALNKINNL